MTYVGISYKSSFVITFESIDHVHKTNEKNIEWNLNPNQI